MTKSSVTTVCLVALAAFGAVVAIAAVFPWAFEQWVFVALGGKP